MEPRMAAGAIGVARRPSTLQMVKEALKAQDGKGASVFAIKQFICAKYPMEDPIRLKYLLKQALSKGLRRGELVRPPNSSAVGATGTFMLAPKEPQHKQKLGQAKPDRGQALKPGKKETTKAPRAPTDSTQQRGATEQQLTAVRKKKPKAKPVDAQLRAAAKPRSEGAKPLQAANHPQAPVTGSSGTLRDTDDSQSRKKGSSGPPGAASHSRAPGRGHSRHPRAADHARAPGKGHSGSRVAAEGGGESDDGSASAGAKGPRKAPGAKSKGQVPRGAQQDVPKAQRGQGQARKPRVTPGTSQGEAKKAAPHAEEREAS